MFQQPQWSRQAREAGGQDSTRGGAEAEVVCQGPFVASVDNPGCTPLGEDDDDLEPPAGLAR